MNELPDFLRSMPNFEYDLEESEDRNKKPRDPRLKWSSHKRVSRMDAVRERDAIGNASTLKSIVAIAKNGHTTTISTLWRERTLTTRVLRRVESSTDFSLSKTGRPDMDITLLYDLPFYARSTIPFLLGIHRDIPNTF